MNRMHSTGRTILLKGQFIRCFTFVLRSRIISVFAFFTGQSNDIPHQKSPYFLRPVFHLHLVSASFFGPKAKPLFYGAYHGRLRPVYSMISLITPAPTVRPPSRIANRSSFSIAIGIIRLTSTDTLSPGITISTPSGNVTTPVTSVVLK